MKNMILKLQEFNDAFKIKYSNPGELKIPDQETKDLRVKLAIEELVEMQEAIDDNNVVELYDALIDRFYLLLGDMVAFGMDYDLLEKGFNEVHKSNMSKLGSDGKPIYRFDKKIIKGPNYFKPDLKKILDNVHNK